MMVEIYHEVSFPPCFPAVFPKRFLFLCACLVLITSIVVVQCSYIYYYDVGGAR